MAKIIKKHWDIFLIGGIGLTLAIMGVLIMPGMIGLPTSYVSAATTATVGVTATVQSWISISVDPTSVTLSPDLVDVGGTAHIGSSTQNVAITLGTNGPSWSITIKGANGGLASSTYDLIDSVALSASTTLSANTDGYGANATNSIAAAAVDSLYKGWGTEKVAAIWTTSQTMVTGTSTSTQEVAQMKVYAACDTAQTATVYGDTITLTSLPGS